MVVASNCIVVTLHRYIAKNGEFKKEEVIAF